MRFILLIFLLAAVCAADKVFVIDTNGKLAEIDLETGTVNPEVAQLGKYPNDILYSGGYLYVINSGSDDKALQKIDAATFEIRNLAIGTGYNCWAGLFVAEDTLVVSAALHNSLVAVATSSMSIVTEAEGIGPNPEWMCLGPECLFVACGGWGKDNNLVACTYSSADTIEVGTNCQSVACDWEDGELFVVNSGVYGNDEGSVSVVDPATGTVTDTLFLGGFPSIICIRGNKAYIGDGWGAGVYVVDTKTHQVLHSQSDPVFTGGTGFALDLSGNLYVSDSKAGQVRIYDEEDKLLATYSVSNPGALVVVETNGIEREGVVPVPGSLTLSPCPAVARVNVSGLEPFASVAFYEISGRCVGTARADGEGEAVFSVSGLPRGVYTAVSGGTAARFSVVR